MTLKIILAYRGEEFCAGDVTVQQYLEGNASLATDLLIKAEKNDMDSSSFIGSYSAVVTPNYVSVPLKRIKSNDRSRNLGLISLKMTMTLTCKMKK